MYSCPTNDIHSIYVDGELPQEFVKDYEEHVKNCDECKKQLNHFQKMHDLFEADKKSIVLSDAFMTQSFDRLQTKLRYAKNTEKMPHDEKKKEQPKNYAIYALAAAILVAAFVPNVTSILKGRTQNTDSVAEIKPITRPLSSTSAIAKENVVINGNINDNIAQNVSTTSLREPQFADVDVFKPQFTDTNQISNLSNGVISIYIDMPGFEHKRIQANLRGSKDLRNVNSVGNVTFTLPLSAQGSPRE